ncbi:Uncharacterised protein [Mycobacteroides abscessus subsp. massiliense]|nr:Uncharacterised protein [Mycobacteroides abscessus subsp. massiliense]
MVGHGMLQGLLFGGDPAGRTVVVRAVMQCGQAPLRQVDCLGQGDGAVGTQHRLRTLDLQLESQ